MDWQGIWDSIVNFFKGNGWTILGFFLTLILGIIVIKILLNIVRRIFTRTKMEKIAQQFLMGTLKFVLYLILILALLGIVGIEISGIITALSAVVLAIGMALEDNIANLANGIVIVSCHMFKKGDYISVDGVEGSIDNINFLFTTINTLDNKKITMPNSKIVNNSVTNAGANTTRRVDFTFSVAYETDVELVKKIVIDVMKSNGKVYDEEGKAPFCRLKTLEESSINFFANCWCDREDYWGVYYYVIENVYNEFKRNNVSIPYNQLEVRNRTDKVVMPYIKEKLPERVEKERNSKHSINLETADFKDILHIKNGKKTKKEKKSKDGKVETTETVEVTEAEVDTTDKK